MNKETFILMMAHSGLSAAASVLAAAAADLERQAAIVNQKELPTVQHLLQLAARKAHLAKALAAADAGIADYLAHN